MKFIVIGWLVAYMWGWIMDHAQHPCGGFDPMRRKAVLWGWFPGLVLWLLDYFRIIKL